MVSNRYAAFFMGVSQSEVFERERKKPDGKASRAKDEMSVRVAPVSGEFRR